MKSLLFLIALASLGFGNLAHAQCNTAFNEICIFFSQECSECVNCLEIGPGIATFYVVLNNPTQHSGVTGYEFCLTNADGSTFPPSPGVSIQSVTLPPDAINFGSPPCFAVGFGSPVPWSPCITLAAINLEILVTQPLCFGVKPADFPSIIGHMSYLDGSNEPVIMFPNNGIDAPDYNMACFNSPECSPIVGVEARSWGMLKSLYR